MRNTLLIACAALLSSCQGLGLGEDAPTHAALFANAGEMTGWQVLGGADFQSATSAEDGSMVLTGHAENMPRNSFLVSNAQYGDFELLVDVRIEAGGNSGVQIRSHVDWDAQDGHGRLWGYQIEIDPSERSWSAGLYDEGRRGWLANLEDNQAAREAFVVGEWNEYRILCEGPRIRTWVNGVPAVDFVDEGKDLDLTGHLAFQVHGGKRSHVQWRDARIRLLAHRS